MKFLADAMLGRLAKWLRILGYDASYLPSSRPEGLVQKARAEGRVILTRNRQLAKQSPGLRILLIESDCWREQLAQVLRSCRLRPGKSRFQRCVLCNQRLVALGREDAEGKVPDFVFVHFSDFFQCPRCGRIFWQGSHSSAMNRIAEELGGTPPARKGERAL
ncbi:MAG: Mut7-C RNAse domain-containing protein [candidate division NC10 bacterium]|nr:Mut7-C RNAse domain-containing protein [candidate division NC10 bacterium]